MKTFLEGYKVMPLINTASTKEEAVKSHSVVVAEMLHGCSVLSLDLTTTR